MVCFVCVISLVSLLLVLCSFFYYLCCCCECCFVFVIVFVLVRGLGCFVELFISVSFFFCFYCMPNDHFVVMSGWLYFLCTSFLLFLCSVVCL